MPIPIPILIAAGVLAIPALVLAFDLLFNSSLRRLAIRNIRRRPGEALLVALGTMLGTAIITAALIVGDSFQETIVDVGRRELGPIDVIAQVDGFGDGAQLIEAVTEIRSTDIDGTLPAVSAGATITNVDGAPRGLPFASIAEIDFDRGRAFGFHPDITGLAGAGTSPDGTEIVISEYLSRRLGVRASDSVDVFAYGSSRRFTVRTVLPQVGLGGWVSGYVPAGTIRSLVAEGSGVAAAPPRVMVLVSNVGGVFDGADRSGRVMAAVEAALDEAGVSDYEVRARKEELIDDARTSGESIEQLFTGIGSFSVVVGILLLVNLFVMLAEERKQELGMLRAVGLKRNHLLRSFSIEGAIYSFFASAIGIFAGAGVAFLISLVAEGLISDDPDGFPLIYHVTVPSMLNGMAIGFTISLITVWLTSLRISRLNVIRAIRDLPEPSPAKPPLRTMVLATAGVALGAIALQLGLATNNAILVTAGPALGLLSSVPLLRRILPGRIASALPAFAALVWGLGVFTLFPEATDDSGIEVFVVQGVVLVAAAVVLASTADRIWASLGERLVGNGRGLATRLALAYPLSRKIRTGILLAMFSLIVFTLTFMSVFSEIFASQAQNFADKDRGGFDVFVQSNFVNPVSAEELLSIDGVERVASFTRAFPEVSGDISPEESRWGAVGIDEDLIAGGVPQVAERADGFGSDEAVYQAVLENPTLTIVPDYFMSRGNGPGGASISLGDVITMHHPRNDNTLEFTVIGITDADFVFNGLVTQRRVLQEFLGNDAFEGRHYVAVDRSADPAAVADRLNVELVERGVQAEGFVQRVRDGLAQQQGFFRLLQGYLALGLVIGVAGLGVVMVRAVHERRRQVGILRAMGFRSRTVRAAFLLEATFIAAQGVAIGIVLGLLSAYQVLTASDAFGSQPLPFAIPWAAIAGIVAIPLVASLLATVAPAAQAARIKPAVALRIAD